MRIVGGKYRGKKLPVSHKLDLRPTTDFAKESLFNLLNTRKDIEDIYFLDVFSGTGNISYELMSRGASGGICVDISLASQKYRQRLITEMGLKGLTSIKSEATRFLKGCSKQFDLIFADPPYDYDGYPELVELIFKKQLLKADGLVIIEHPENHTFDSHPHFTEHRKYGRVHFSFFKTEQ